MTNATNSRELGDAVATLRQAEARVVLRAVVSKCSGTASEFASYLNMDEPPVQELLATFVDKGLVILEQVVHPC